MHSLTFSHIILVSEYLGYWLLKGDSFRRYIVLRNMALGTCNNYVAGAFRTGQTLGPWKHRNLSLRIPNAIYYFNLNILVGLWPEKLMKVRMNCFSAQHQPTVSQTLHNSQLQNRESIECEFIWVNAEILGWIRLNIKILKIPPTTFVLSQIAVKSQDVMLWSYHPFTVNSTDNLSLIVILAAAFLKDASELLWHNQ